MKRTAVAASLSWALACTSLPLHASWLSTGDLNVARDGHTLTILTSGRVLAVGGSGTVLTELYDPATGTWRATGNLEQERINHTATLLPSGKVLVAGGQDEDGNTLAHFELYDPATGTWSPTGASCASRHNHTATLLVSGEVLLVGGSSGGMARQSVEIYDPGDPEGTPDSHLDGDCSATAGLTTGRELHTATRLPGGEVLVLGGTGGVRLKSAELYVPPGAASPACSPAPCWASPGDLATAREVHTATLLATGPDAGRVLVAGGRASFVTVLESVELYRYDPVTGMGTTTTSSTHPDLDLGAARERHTATLLATGEVLVAGGNGPLRSAELFNPLDRSWGPVSDMAFARTDNPAVLLPSGQVLVGGGDNADGSCELYEPTNASWKAIASSHDPDDRRSHTATLLTDRRVLVVGGQIGPGVSARVDLYAPASPPASRWSAGTALPAPRLYHTATLLLSGDVLVVGGQSGTGALQASRLYRAGAWVAPAGGDPAGLIRRHHTATLLADGRVLVAGGSDGTALATAALFDPDAGPDPETWTFTAPTSTARVWHSATLLATGEVLVAGGYDQDDQESDAGTPLVSAELYDPAAGTWRPTTSLIGRRRHTATLLPSGRVLVVGGSNGPASYLTSAQLYDPATGTWTFTGGLATARALHTATLLPSGKVLVTGGFNSDGIVTTAELYDPAAGAWRPLPGPLKAGTEHTATLLTTGEVLVLGADGGADVYDGELYDPGTITPGRRPVIGGFPATLRHDTVSALTGSGFDGDSEATGGGTSASGVNHPLVQLRSVEGTHQAWLVPNPQTSFAGDSLTLGDDLDPATADLPPHFDLPALFNPGWHYLTLFTHGVASESELVRLECSLLIETPPADPTPRPEVGETATFTVVTRGARLFQWEKCHGDSLTTCAPGGPGWQSVDGATASSFTTPPIQAADAGTLYRVQVGSGCDSATSQPATLTVDDQTRPGCSDPDPAAAAPADPCPAPGGDADPPVAVVTPNGGDLWTLSQRDEMGTLVENRETVTWTMSDDVRICRVDLELLFSTDGGRTYEAFVDPDPGTVVAGELPRSFGPGGACTHPGVETTSYAYTVPETPPSGEVGSLYRVRLTVTDHAGNARTDESDKPFFLVEPNDDSVTTLILWHPERMAGLGMETADLEIALDDLANHARVAGRIVDLGGFPALDVGAADNLYAQWDAGTVGANDLLFGAAGVHESLLAQLDVFTAVQYLVLVGDDRVLPLARISDGTVQVSESFYTSLDPGADLSPDGTTVGRALAANKYLTDDPLAFKEAVAPAELDGSVFLPDLAVGRLVETPDEIVAAISTFISQDGILDLTAATNKVLVSGYDFLLDAGTKIRESWAGLLASGVEGGTLVEATQSWGATELRNLLCPAVDDPYAVASLNGHATHYLEGIPGATGAFDIDGLDTGLIAGACPLPGAVVYAVGCHSGLPVAGSSHADDRDHPQDLPQTLLAEGVMAYVGNTGFGWGLKHGLGYGERLVAGFTDELASGGGLVAVGDAVRRTKLRYFLETPRFDAYDEKSLQQWTLFGFPMYAVKTGLAARSAGGRRRAFEGLPPRPEELAARESFGPVTVSRRLAPRTKGLPSFLTRLDLTFDFTADGVYKLVSALGTEVATPADADTFCHASGPAPPAGVPKGCYYTLNNVTTGGTDRETGMTDRPIQPMFIFDSRLSGTSQHGYLWKGGTYEETTGWVPVVAELQSNQAPEDAGFFSDHGAAPRHLVGRPGGASHTGGGVDECAASDLEVASLVFEAGEVLKADDSDPDYDIQRIYSTVDLELFYFNNPGDPDANCDRDGPGIAAGPFAGAYHEVDGNTVSWQVPVADAGGVWRVLVVYNDGTTVEDGQGSQVGRWLPLELAETGPGTWGASLTLSGSGRITYMIQAVDNRGNVSWLEFLPATAADDPSSGVPLDLPLPADVGFSPNPADLGVTLTDAPDPVTAGELLGYTLQVTNLSAVTASGVQVVQTLPPGASGVFVSAAGWSCSVGSQVTCGRAAVAAGAAPPIAVFMTAPATAGIVSSSVTVTSAADGTPGNDTATAETTVEDDGAPPTSPLSIALSDGGAVARSGSVLVYTLTVSNNGPDPVNGAQVYDGFSTEVTAVAWVCAATPGSSCSARGSGTISDPVDLAAGGSVTYVAAAALGTLSGKVVVNTASVTALGVSLFSTAITPTQIFSDGFESGSLSAWSDVTAKTWTLELEQLAARVAGRARGRLVLDAEGPELAGPGPRFAVAVDPATRRPLLGLALRRRGAWPPSLELLVLAGTADGGWHEVVPVELGTGVHTLELEWHPASGAVLELTIDGAPMDVDGR